MAAAGSTAPRANVASAEPPVPQAVVDQLPPEERGQAERTNMVAEAEHLGREAERLDREAPALGSASDAVTVKDVLGLVAEMQRQITSLMAQVNSQDKRDPRQSTQSSADELRKDAEQRRALLETWKTEPREHIFVNPAPEEVKLAQATHGEMPPRLLQVNGVDFPIKVGVVVEVPASIAALVRHTQRLGDLIGRPAQELESIPRPRPREIEAGRPGVVGEGSLTYFSRESVMPLGPVNR